MDLAEETFCETRSLPGNKLTKALWRDFTDIFIDGKKVSLRNVVKKVVSAENTAESRKTDTAADESMQPHDILVKCRNETPMFDLMEYVSNSGMFNLGQISKNLCSQVARSLKLELDTKDGSLRQNVQVGMTIEGLFMDPMMRDRIASSLKIED